jgi:hypothetical protein
MTKLKRQLLSSIANAERKIFGNAAKTMSEWSKKQAEAKDAKTRY